jgi:hypothetical protein
MKIPFLILKTSMHRSSKINFHRVAILKQD